MRGRGCRQKSSESRRFGMIPVLLASALAGAIYALVLTA